MCPMKPRLPKHVTIVYNSPTSGSAHPLAPTTDGDTESTPKEIRNLLLKHGVNARLFPLRSVRDLKKLRRIRTSLVFNCVEDDIGSSAFNQHLVAKTLEDAGIPFTGGTAGNILLTTNKAATKQYLLTNGIPTPQFAVVEKPDYLDMAYHLRSMFPLIVKPVAMDGSEGITQKSVVTNEETLQKQVSSVVKTFNQPAIVERYINTRELNVAVIEKNGRPYLFPPSEIVFTRGYGQKYKIVDFSSKWRPKTAQYKHTKGVCPANLKPALLKKLNEITLSIWKLMSLQSYVRVDFRIDKEGAPYVLEINVNPDISNDPQTGFPRAARVAGLPWDKMILTIISSAMYRHQR